MAGESLSPGGEQNKHDNPYDSLTEMPSFKEHLENEKSNASAKEQWGEDAAEEVSFDFDQGRLPFDDEYFSNKLRVGSGEFTERPATEKYIIRRVARQLAEKYNQENGNQDVDFIKRGKYSEQAWSLYRLFKGESIEFQMTSLIKQQLERSVSNYEKQGGDFDTTRIPSIKGTALGLTWLAQTSNLLGKMRRELSRQSQGKNESKADTEDFSGYNF